jgi:hypothetical protein
VEKAKIEPRCDKLRRPTKRFIDPIYGRMTCRLRVAARNNCLKADVRYNQLSRPKHRWLDFF